MLATGNPVVPASGSPFSKLAIVGARPGKDEVRYGRPFQGASGRLLWNLLPMERGDVYVDNVCQDFNPAASVPTRGEIQDALPSLRERLRTTDSNVILVLGGQALEALTNKTSIDKYRGSILESTLVPGKKVVCAWHPSHILRGQYERRYILHADLRRAVQQAEFPEIRRRSRDFRLNPTYTEAVEFIETLGDPVTIDIECSRTDLDIIYCLGLGDSPERAMCIPFTWGRIKGVELASLFRLIQRKVFDEKRIIGQNVIFDTWRLERVGFRIQHLYFCTMLAHHLLWPEAGTRQKDAQGKDNFAGGHDLGFLGSIYTEEPYYKNEGDDPSNLSRYWTYNCKDVAVTHECYDGLVEELQEFDQEVYYHEHVRSLIRPILAMQNKGMCVDKEKAQSIGRRIELETRVLQGRLNQVVGFDLNVRSPPQMRHLIQDVLKMRISKRTKKGGMPATDKETLLTLAYGSEHGPIFKRILDIRERRTLSSSFLRIETNPDNGRYGAPYKIHGTDSGRLSSTSPKNLENRDGPQLQNIPPRARRVFIADDDCVFILSDLRRAEAMYVAYDAGDEDLIAIFNDPERDLYKEVASESLGKPIGSIAKIERTCFKHGIHASHYQVGPRRYIEILRKFKIDIEDVSVKGITRPLKKAEFFLETYLEKHSKIKEWQQDIQEQVRKTRVLHSSFGRRRFFMGDIQDSHTLRVALSYRPQASIVGITNRALRMLWNEGYTPLLQIHDNSGLEVEYREYDKGWEDLEKALTHPITLHGRTFTVPLDTEWGFNWAPYHEIENPGGLRGGRVMASELPRIYAETRSA